MGSLKDKLRHAFAVDPPGPAEPTPAQEIPVDWLCRQIARRHLTTAGLAAMELCRPLNWVFAQGMHVAQPAIWAVAPGAFYEHYKNFASFLEQRGSLEHVCRRLEELEQHSTPRREKTPRTTGDAPADGKR